MIGFNRLSIALSSAVLLATAAACSGGGGGGGNNGGAPTVLSTSPTDAAMNIPRNTTVTATFSEAMNPATLTTAATFTLKQGATVVPGAVTYAGSVATLTLSSNLTSNTTYTATITTAAEDVGGTPLQVAKTWSFTTKNTSVSGPGVVNLGTASTYVILAKSGISTTGTTAVVGDMGLSPIAATGITGFALSSPPTDHTTSALVTGFVYASDYAPPTPANLGIAVLDMQAAYTDAAGRTLPDFTELGAGDIDGQTLVPGLYKWGTGLMFANGITITGSATDTWIFQVAGNLTVGDGAMVTLAGGARPENIVWQVAGSASFGTTSNFKGIVLCQTQISYNTNSIMLGRALAQTAVTLNSTTITKPN